MIWFFGILTIYNWTFVCLKCKTGSLKRMLFAPTFQSCFTDHLRWRHSHSHGQRGQKQPCLGMDGTNSLKVRLNRRLPSNCITKPKDLLVEAFRINLAWGAANQRRDCGASPKYQTGTYPRARTQPGTRSFQIHSVCFRQALYSCKEKRH